MEHIKSNQIKQYIFLQFHGNLMISIDSTSFHVHLFHCILDGLLQNDTLCVYGDLCLWSESFKNSSSVTRLSPDILVPPCDLATDLRALWQDPEGTHADIKIVTEQKSFMAHK